MAQVNFQGINLHEDLVSTCEVVTSLVVPNATKIQFNVVEDHSCAFLWWLDNDDKILQEYIWDAIDTEALFQEGMAALQALLALPCIVNQLPGKPDVVPMEETEE